MVYIRSISSIRRKGLNTASVIDQPYKEFEIIVNSALDIKDPRKGYVYYLDGEIDMTGVSINPSEGIEIIGSGRNSSVLLCTEDNYSLFSSATVNGDINISNISIKITGLNSKVFDVQDSDGTHAIEQDKVNYISCTSLGEMNGFRQGLETNSARINGTPSLTLSGTWTGGYRISTSIIINPDNAMTEPFFKAGTAFSMESRFFSDINANLGDTAAFTDFSPSNFTNDNLIQFKSANITRNGLYNPLDNTITPNLKASDLVSFWKDNIGFENTLKGGLLNVDTEVVTVVGSINTYYDLGATWGIRSNEHMDSPSNGRLRQTSNLPTEYVLTGSLVLASTANNVIDVQIVINRASTGLDEVGRHISKVVNNNTGPRDVAFFNLEDTLTLFENDTVRLQVENKTGANNITAEVDSFWRLDAR